MRKSLFITQGAAVAAVYVVLTLVSNAFGLANHAVQCRLSEALTVLPCVMPAAIPGLFIGCLLSNVLTGATLIDIIFGGLATLIGAVGTYLLRKHPYLASIPPIVSNTIIIPLVLIYAYHVEDAYYFLMLTVGIGEIISAGVLGTLFLIYIKKRTTLFK